jgi:hypothetical protein
MFLANRVMPVDIIQPEQLIGQPADGRLLRQAGRGFDEFDAAKDAARLILPAAAGRQHLLQRQRAGKQDVSIPSQSAQIAQRGQNRRRQNAARAQARSLGRGRDQRDFNAAAKFGQLLRQRGESAPGMKARQKSGQGEGGLGQGKRIARLGESFQIGVGFDALLHAKINRAHDQFRPLAQFGKHLNGRLAVDVHRQIEHVPAILDAIRRRVGPTAGQIQPHRAARPNDLVIQDVAARRGG